MMRQYIYNINFKKKLVVFAVLFGVTVFYVYNIYLVVFPFTKYDKSKARNPYYLIETQGCSIPNYTNDFYYEKPTNILSDQRCEERAIFIKKLSGNEIQFIIDESKFAKMLTKYKLNYICHYQFVIRSFTYVYEDSKPKKHLKRKSFKNGTIVQLKAEVIEVNCKFIVNSTTTINLQPLDIVFYKDSYIILKKLNDPANQKPKNKWNVLLLGMATMSRTRAYNTIPKTINFMNQLQWLDFKAYHNIATKTYPNLISLLTGKINISGETENKLIAYNTFKKHGYVTAYGEDETQLDTINKYGGLRTQPIDHYMQPLFLTGEKTRDNFVGTSKFSSGENLMQYVYDFAYTYYRSHNFFGFFWMNSYSRNLNSYPARLDHKLRHFFMKLHESGILENTFVIFLSDHGIKFGIQRYPIEAFYDERLPMLFMWVPHKFRKLHPAMYSDAVTNQERLITPYDLHATLIDFLRLSKDYHKIVPGVLYPAHCMSIFKEHDVTRTCADAMVSNKICACHLMRTANHDEKVYKVPVDVLVRHVQNHVESILTEKCKKCTPVRLKSVMRVNWYKSGKSKFYVIAFRVTSTNLYYEGVVSEHDGKYHVEGDVEVISSWGAAVVDDCALEYNQRAECRCMTLC